MGEGIMTLTRELSINDFNDSLKIETNPVSAKSHSRGQDPVADMAY